MGDRTPSKSDKADPKSDPGGDSPVYAEPAVTKADAASFDAAPPDPDRLKAPDARDWHRTVRGVLKCLDRALSFVLRVPRYGTEELAEFTEMIAPAAEQFGPRAGWKFWALVALVGFGAFVAGKLAQRMVLVSDAAAADQAETDGGDPRESRARALGGEPIYPRDRAA